MIMKSIVATAALALLSSSSVSAMKTYQLNGETIYQNMPVRVNGIPQDCQLW